MSVFGVIKLKKAVILAVAIVLLAGILTALIVPNLDARSEPRKLPVYCVEDAVKIAITFDASWGAERTKSIVDQLVQKGIKATFFLTGIWIDDYPEETKYIAEKGMEIGNHSRRHYNMGKMSAEKIEEEIDTVNEMIFTLTGQTPTVFRAPFGDYGNALIKVLDGKGMRCIQWDVDSLDWKGLSGKEIVDRVVSKTKGGSIILCHNNSEHIMDALPAIIDTLSVKYTFVTVSELLDGKTGTIDHTGKLREKP